MRPFSRARASSSGVLGEERDVDDVLARLEGTSQRLEPHEARHRADHEVLTLEDPAESGRVREICLNRDDAGRPFEAGERLGRRIGGRHLELARRGEVADDGAADAAGAENDDFLHGVDPS